MIRRFHNQQLRIPQPNHRDSITKLTRFHNQNLTTSQTKSQDSTTTLPQFHNRNVAIHSIPPPWSVHTKSSHPWCLKEPTPLVSAHKVFTSMMIPPPRSGLTQSSHPWYLKDPTPLVGAYTVFTSMISQRSHPLGQCVQSLHIHDISKIPPPWSVRTKSSHPWYLKDPTPLVGADTVFASMISQRSHPLGRGLHSLHIHDISKIPPPGSVRAKSSNPWCPTPMVGAFAAFTSSGETTPFWIRLDDECSCSTSGRSLHCHCITSGRSLHYFTNTTALVHEYKFPTTVGSRIELYKFTNLSSRR